MATIKINIILFGIGNIGSAFIKEVIEQQQSLLEEKNIELVFAIITNSTLAFFEKENEKNKWEANFTKANVPFSIHNIIAYVKTQGLENLIAIDATSSIEILKSYNLMVQNNFNILSINEKSSKQSLEFYAKINTNLQKTDKQFRYNNKTTIITPTNLLDHLLQITASVLKPDLQSA